SFEDLREPYTWPDTNVNRLAALAFKGSHALGPSLLLAGNAYLRDLRNRNVSSNVNDSFGDDDPVAARNDRALIEQRSAGIGLQLTRTGTLAGFASRHSVGLSLDRGRARLGSESQPASFTADRATVALGPYEPEVDAESTTRLLGAFVSAALDLGPRWGLTLAGRFNRADVRIVDRSGTTPALNGTHRFQRFNPSVGISVDTD